MDQYGIVPGSCLPGPAVLTALLAHRGGVAEGLTALARCVRVDDRKRDQGEHHETRQEVYRFGSIGTSTTLSATRATASIAKAAANSRKRESRVRR